MEIFDAILSTEVIAGIIIISAFAMAIRSVLHFTQEAADLRPKLAEVERELNKLRNGMGDRKKAVEELFGGNSPKQIAGIPVDIDPALATQQARILLGEKSEPGRQT